MPNFKTNSPKQSFEAILKTHIQLNQTNRNSPDQTNSANPINPTYPNSWVADISVEKGLHIPQSKPL